MTPSKQVASVLLAAGLGLLGAGATASAAEPKPTAVSLPEVGTVEIELSPVVETTTEVVEKVTGATLPPPPPTPATPPVSVPPVSVPHVSEPPETTPAEPRPDDVSPSPQTAPADAAAGGPEGQPVAAASPDPETSYSPGYDPAYAPAGEATGPPIGGGGPTRRGGVDPPPPVRTTGAPRPTDPALDLLQPGMPRSLLAKFGRRQRSLTASLGELGEAAVQAIVAAAGSPTAAIGLARPISDPAPDPASSRFPAVGPWLGADPALPAALFYLVLAAAALAVWAASRRGLGLSVISKRWRH